jgi:hypothetical protein
MFARDEIIGQVFNLLTHKALREVTREIITPLVQAASVAKKHKLRALSVPPQGVHPDELEHENDAVTDALAHLIEAGVLTLNARGAYEYVGTKPPEPNTAEAIKHAAEILDGWPEDAAQKILAVLEE